MNGATRAVRRLTYGSKVLRYELSGKAFCYRILRQPDAEEVCWASFIPRTLAYPSTEYRTEGPMAVACRVQTCPMLPLL